MTALASKPASRRRSAAASPARRRTAARAASPCLLVLENRGIAALHLPGLEERRPVDVGDRASASVDVEASCVPRKAGPAAVPSRPVDLESGWRARAESAGATLVLLRRARARRRALRIRPAHVGDIAGSVVVRQQRRDDADGAAGVGHIDRLAALVGRDGSSPPCGRGSWSRRRSAAAGRSPRAPSRRRHAPSRRARA